jgi:ribosome-binding ATPase YchF (GTP1/OBG family)
VGGLGIRDDRGRNGDSTLAASEYANCSSCPCAPLRAGSYAAAREQGLLRLEGKDYIMQEGDVVHFRFNV